MLVTLYPLCLRATSATIVLGVLFGSVAMADASEIVSKHYHHHRVLVPDEYIEHTLNFTEFENGDYIISNQLLSSPCVTINAIANGRTGGAARVFDTAITSNCDNELEINVGKVLIIQNEPNDATENSCPAAHANGGNITFDFCQRVLIQQVVILTRGNTRLLYYNGAQLVRKTYINRDTLWTLNPNQANVTRLVHEMAFKGGIRSLKYLQCLPPTSAPTPVPTLPPTRAPTPVPTMPSTLPPTPEPTSMPTMPPTPVPTPVPTLVPTMPPTLVPTPVPTSMPTAPCIDASQLNDQQLQEACNDLPDGQKCCQDNGCSDGTNGIVCSNSCNGNSACDSMNGFAGAGSCNGVRACQSMSLPVIVGAGSCIGVDACAGMAGFVGAGSCIGNGACVFMNGFVADESCNANQACFAFSGFASQNSCNDANSCRNINAYVEEDGEEEKRVDMVDVMDCPSTPPTDFPQACMNFDLCCEARDTNACRDNFMGKSCP